MAAYLHHEITLAQLVDWAENASRPKERNEHDIARRRDDSWGLAALARPGAD